MLFWNPMRIFSFVRTTNLLERRSDHIARPRLLHENNHPQILWVQTWLKLRLVVLGEGLSFFQLANLGKVLNDGYVCQVPSTVFSV